MLNVLPTSYSHNERNTGMIFRNMLLFVGNKSKQKTKGQRREREREREGKNELMNSV